jgi:Raf kinase inhibitor-like YbhB/YbcL family protein
MKRLLSVPAAAVIVLTGLATTKDAPAQATAAGFHLTSPVFVEGQEIPTLYTCAGTNVSPPLSWNEPPRTPTSFALVVTDPDAHDKSGRPFVHWILFNVPHDTRALAENIRRNRLPGAAAEGSNDFKREGFDGPCPPNGRHRYVFALYALDTTLDRTKFQRATWPEFESAFSGHIIATATLTGTFEKGKGRGN